MAWYKTGTITVTNGSASVTGAGTSWVDVGTLNAGDILVAPDGKQYEILSVGSNTGLTLASNYLGTGLGGQAYAIYPIGLLPSTLAQQVKSTLSTANTALASAVRYDTAAMGLTATQQQNARTNIGALGALDVGVGRLSKSVAGGVDITLSATEAANQFIELTGTLTASINVIVPAAARLFFIYNNTSGAYTITVKTPSGTGLIVLQAYRTMLECDSTNVVNPFNLAIGAQLISGSLAVAGAFSVTGNSALRGSANVIGGDTSSAGSALQISNGAQGLEVDISAAATAKLLAYNRVGATYAALNCTAASYAWSISGASNAMALSSIGTLTATCTGNGHALICSASSYTGHVLYVQNTAATGSTSWDGFSVYDSVGASCRIYGNGNIQNANNSYGSLSDRKLKQDIVLAGSQWNDVKALSSTISKFRLKADPMGPLQLGLIAQDVQSISPGIVYSSPDRDIEGNDLGTETLGVHYSVAYMKAFKATGEILDYIDTSVKPMFLNHEFRIAALESVLIH